MTKKDRISIAIGILIGALAAGAGMMFFYERDYDPYAHEGMAYQEGQEGTDGAQSMVVLVLEQGQDEVNVVGCPSRPDGSPNIWAITDPNLVAYAQPGMYVPIYYETIGENFNLIGWAEPK